MDTHHSIHWKHWANRFLLALEGAAAGAVAATVIALFRITRDTAAPLVGQWLSSWREHGIIVPILWLAALIAAARFLGWLVQQVPLASGSGIPQTEFVISGHLHISRMDWLKVLAAKFTGCLIAMLGGLSLGRAAPCIQMGAASAALVNGLWEHISFSGHIHISAGAAAGLTAAFGSPVAGLLFVFEEMCTRRTRMGFLVILSAVITADIVTRFGFGLGTLFPFPSLRALPLASFWLLLPFGLFLGAAGAAYCHALIGLKNAEAHYTPLSQNWRILPPMLAAFVLAFTFPAVLGGGDELVASLIRLEPEPETLLRLLAVTVLLKISFALFSYTGNVPGGILMPILCIGALFGALYGQSLLALALIDAQTWPQFIIFGMAGFFSAVIRTPFTGTAVAAEITGSFLCLPGCAVAAFLASWTADRLRTAPIYASMRAAMVIPPRRR